MTTGYTPAETVEEIYNERRKPQTDTSPYRAFYYEEFKRRRFIEHKKTYEVYGQVTVIHPQGDMYNVHYAFSASPGFSRSPHSVYQEPTARLSIPVFEPVVQADIDVADKVYLALAALKQYPKVLFAYQAYIKRLDVEFEGCMNGAGASVVHYRADLRHLLDEVTYLVQLIDLQE